MTTIYFTDHQKRQIVDFLKKYSSIIYVKNYLEREFEKFAFEKTKSISALTLEFSKWGNYVTTKRCFKQLYKSIVFLERYNKNCSRSVTCNSYTTRYIYVKSSKLDKLF